MYESRDLFRLFKLRILGYFYGSGISGRSQAFNNSFNFMDQICYHIANFVPIFDRYYRPVIQIGAEIVVTLSVRHFKIMH